MTQSNRPLVSIIIPCYNYCHTVSETLNSVVNQTYINWEILVIDDGSTDDTAKVVQDYVRKDTRVVYHYQNNKGLSAARNKGIELAKGKFLIFLDSDDVLLPAMLEKCVNRFEQNNQFVLVYTGMHYGTYNLKKLISTESPKQDLRNPFTRLSVKNIAPCHAVMIKSEVIGNTGNFDESLKSCEDWDLWLRIARTTDTFGVVREPLCVYRMSQSSMSRNPQTFFESAKIVLNRALQKDDLRVKNQKTDLQFITKKEHNTALIRWVMLNTGTYIFNNQLDVGNLFFINNIKGHEPYITSESFKNMVSYLTFTEGKNELQIRQFYKENSKNLMLFLARQEDALQITGLAAEAFIIVMSNAGYSWDFVIKNIPIKKLYKLVFNRLLNKVKK